MTTYTCDCGFSTEQFSAALEHSERRGHHASSLPPEAFQR
jgi:hypothetical protein